MSEVAVAGLRTFVAERFGSAAAAFARMDFYRNGKVSCLEFQEVISGQERYCGLKEARELFCMLTRGGKGWLRLEDFERHMAGASTPSGVLQEAIREEFSASVCDRSYDAASETSQRAGFALRALFASGHDQSVAMSSRVDDSAATQADRSWLSGYLPARSSSASVLPAALPDRYGVDGGVPSRLEAGVPLHAEGHHRDGDISVLRQLDDGLHSLRAEAASIGLRTELASFGALLVPPAAPPELQGGDSALHKLDEGLHSLREEIAALNAFRSSGSRGGDPYSSPRSPSSPSRRPCVARSPPRAAVGGLPWVAQLPEHAQGRLAACATLEEALEVLDEELAMASLSTPSNVQLGSKSGPDDATIATESGARPELVAASVNLLQVAREQTRNLERELEERLRLHKEEVADLRRQHRNDRSRMLQRMMDRVSVQPDGPESPEALKASSRERVSLQRRPMPSDARGTATAPAASVRIKRRTAQASVC